MPSDPKPQSKKRQLTHKDFYKLTNFINDSWTKIEQEKFTFEKILEFVRKNHRADMPENSVRTALKTLDKKPPVRQEYATQSRKELAEVVKGVISLVDVVIRLLDSLTNDLGIPPNTFKEDLQEIKEKLQT